MLRVSQEVLSMEKPKLMASLHRYLILILERGSRSPAPFSSMPLRTPWRGRHSLRLSGVSQSLCRFLAAMQASHRFYLNSRVAQTNVVYC